MSELSNCCDAQVRVVSANEGTSYYVCLWCNNPCDIKSSNGVQLEPENTLIGRFQKERTDAISEMLDNVDSNGIYPTTKFFCRLDDCVRKLIKEAQKQYLEM